ncbi:TadE family type IV pilus minor pilin [Micrococcaceae bacterium Sec5.7]
MTPVHRGDDVRGRGNARGAVNSGRGGTSRTGDRSRGAVTAELAVVLPAVLLLLALLLAGSAAGVTQLRLEEAARAGARALARGESAGAVDGIVRTLAGASASAAVVADGEWLRVTVSDRAGGPFGSTVPWTLTARASARAETASSAAASLPLAAVVAPVAFVHTVESRCYGRSAVA